MPNRKLIVTNDGSHTVFDPVYNSHFHSIHGAITESKHVFIKHGLEYISNTKPELSIFELGFGTGLNAYLSFLFSRIGSVKINYTAIDSNPLNLEIARNLNYPELLSSQFIEPHFLDFHTCEWNQPNDLNDCFNLNKIISDWESFSPMGLFDLIYFDAFDPVSQPYLWDLASFYKLYDIMSDGAVLCTYCAKGIVRRNLKEVGFKIESLPGPPGKREMTRAFKL